MSIKPYARPDVRAQDVDAVVEVLNSQFLTTGPKIAELEAFFVQMVGAHEAVACSNGTTALHLAALALDLKPGDWVIVPAVTFLATANAVRMCGAEVVFADVAAENGLLTLSGLQEAESRAKGPIKAVFPVHMGGHCCDMKAISQYAQEKGWAVVEDACHALGGRSQGQWVGSCGYSDLACFSLHATKSFAAAEGGVVTTNRPDLAQRMRRLRNHGMNREGDFLNPELAYDAGEVNPWYYEMDELGYNYRLSDIQAALALSQLKRKENVAKTRAELVAAYRLGLKGLAPVLRPVAPNGLGDPLLHLFQVLIDFDKLGKSRAQVCRELRAKGVGTQVHYIPLHHQPYYQKRYGEVQLDGADSFYEQVLALPLYSALTTKDVETIVQAVHQVMQGG